VASDTNVVTGCLLVGEFVDEATSPDNAKISGGEVQRPRVISDSQDIWGPAHALKDFTVLLKDGRTLTVRGSGLRHSPHSVPGQDIYSVVIQTAANDVVVALFKSDEVAGIFHGELLAERKIA
jgi:hypothetical protein